MTPELSSAHDRIFDLLLADDGQAWKEAAKYLDRANPELYARLQAVNPTVVGAELPDWRTPTKFLTRMGDAMQVMCRGHRPPDEMIAAWFDPVAEDDQLQHFAAEHGLAWAQGIGIIDAATLMSDQPTEGPAHEYREPRAKASTLSHRAMVFAREAHAGQVRKYTGNPYADHLAEVAGIVATALPRMDPGIRETALACAWLHDYVEDINPKDGIGELVMEFGPRVSNGILMLSDLETGNRKERKAASCARLAGAEGWLQTVKCADLISNTSSIVKHDPDFARVYLHEKRALLEGMTKADPLLREMAQSIANMIPPAKTGDEFNGNDTQLVAAIKALLSLDAAGALVPHGVIGHARTLLAASASRLGRAS